MRSRYLTHMAVSKCVPMSGFEMWWSYCSEWYSEWWAAIRAGKSKDLALSAVGSGIGVLYGYERGWVKRDHFLEILWVAVLGYVALLLLTWIWHGLFAPVKIYHKHNLQLTELRLNLDGEIHLSRRAVAEFIRQSVDVIGMRLKVRVAEGELGPIKRELEDAYSLIEKLKPFKDEAESLRKRIEDKEREPTALTPLEKQAGLRLQAQGVAQTIYDHNLKGWKRDFEGQAKGHGLTIVIQIANLAVRGVSAKTVRVRAQAIYIKGDEQYVLAPLVWLDSSTSDVIIEPGEIREIIIARKLMFDFWDFTTHGGHGNVTPEQGIDFDLDVQLVDVDSGTILDVKPTTYFHWRWREGPLTPFFHPVLPPAPEKELKADAGESK